MQELPPCGAWPTRAGYPYDATRVKWSTPLPASWESAPAMRVKYAWHAELSVAAFIAAFADAWSAQYRRSTHSPFPLRSRSRRRKRSEEHTSELQSLRHLV